ncbi:hypothetical protein F8271_07705 [Micromonospora sp. ALFpr18c]|nr:hypothetical protein F8271_07705 [Micromonospora sp. ALFpr18c]
MKYMILLYGSQQDYDVLSGRASDRPASRAIGHVVSLPRVERKRSWITTRRNTPAVRNSTPQQPLCMLCSLCTRNSVTTRRSPLRAASTGRWPV